MDMKKKSTTSSAVQRYTPTASTSYRCLHPTCNCTWKSRSPTTFGCLHWIPSLSYFHNPTEHVCVVMSILHQRNADTWPRGWNFLARLVKHPYSCQLSWFRNVLPIPQPQHLPFRWLVLEWQSTKVANRLLRSYRYHWGSGVSAGRCSRYSLGSD